MKKIFLFVAAIAAVMSVNAQDKVVKDITDYANYIEFQSLVDADNTLTSKTMSSTQTVTLPNGTVLKGFLKSDGTEAECKWNAKTSLVSTYFVADGLAGVDSINCGTQWRAASGCTMTLGAFKLTANGKIKVFYQLNGDDSSKSGDKIRGIAMILDGGEPIEYRFATGKNLVVASFDLEAGEYLAGDVVFKVVGNTINVCGIQIENLNRTAVDEVEADAPKAQKFMENGQLVIKKGDKKYNALGAEL